MYYASDPFDNMQNVPSTPFIMGKCLNNNYKKQNRQFKNPVFFTFKPAKMYINKILLDALAMYTSLYLTLLFFLQCDIILSKHNSSDLPFTTLWSLQIPSKGSGIRLKVYNMERDTEIVVCVWRAAVCSIRLLWTHILTLRRQDTRTIHSHCPWSWRSFRASIAFR